MFSLTNLELARSQAVSLANEDLMVVPTKDSALNEMLSLINSGTMEAVLQADMTEPVADMLLPLDPIVDEIAINWADEIQNTIEILMSQTVPVYTNFIQALQANKQTTEQGPLAPATHIAVEVLDIPTWYTDNAAWYQPREQKNPPSFGALNASIPDPRLDPAFIDAILRTVSPPADTARAYNWRLLLSHSLLKGTTAAFRGNLDSDGLIMTFNSAPPFSRLSDAVALHILANAVLRTPSTETIATDAASYQAYLVNLTRVAAYIIEATLPLVRLYEQQRVLILGKDLMLKKIQVLASSYETYYQQGGTLDAILGAYISEDNVNSIDGVLNNQALYLGRWAQYHAEQTATENRLQLQALRRSTRAIVDGMTLTLNEAHDYGLDTGDYLPVELKRRLFTVIDSLTLNDFGSTEQAALKVLQARFIDPKVIDFLNDVAEISYILQENAMKKTVVLHYAVKNMLARYLATQVKLVNLSEPLPNAPQS